MEGFLQTGRIGIEMTDTYEEQKEIRIIAWHYMCESDPYLHRFENADEANLFFKHRWSPHIIRQRPFTLREEFSYEQDKKRLDLVNWVYYLAYCYQVDSENAMSIFESFTCEQNATDYFEQTCGKYLITQFPLTLDEYEIAIVRCLGDRWNTLQASDVLKVNTPFLNYDDAFLELSSREKERLLWQVAAAIRSIRISSDFTYRLYLRDLRDQLAFPDHPDVKTIIRSAYELVDPQEFKRIIRLRRYLYYPRTCFQPNITDKEIERLRQIMLKREQRQIVKLINEHLWSRKCVPYFNNQLLWDDIIIELYRQNTTASWRTSIILDLLNHDVDRYFINLKRVLRKPFISPQFNELQLKQAKYPHLHVYVNGKKQVPKLSEIIWCKLISGQLNRIILADSSTWLRFYEDNAIRLNE
jgi:hypothetical protein